MTAAHPNPRPIDAAGRPDLCSPHRYFSGETYTTLGFGDLTPTGPVRLLAGIEALNGLLLIGWSASFTYVSMERFWGLDTQRDGR